MTGSSTRTPGTVAAPPFERISADDLARTLGLPTPTPEQQGVISAPLAPSLVVAGAGSGKTETMAARVVYLVANGWVRPEQVLGLTFTRKAAGQLAERIRTRLRALAGARVVTDEVAEALAGAEPDVSTYHAFAGRLLGEYGPLVGVEPASRVLTPTSSWQLARALVGRWDVDLDTDASPDQVTESLLALSGVLADHLRTPADLTEHLARLTDRILAARPSARQKGPLLKELSGRVENLARRQWVLPLVEAFAELKRSEGVVDFSDQMQLAAELVAAHPSIPAALRERHRVVLLDEYQDTGHSQRVILRTVFGRPETAEAAGGRVKGAGGGRAGGPPVAGHPVTAVGDPVQSIYTWRGASASNLRRFGEDFPQADGTPAPRFTLLTSFRNPPEVLELANGLSAPVRHDVDGLRPRPGAPAGTLAYGLFHTIGEENRWLAERIAEHWQLAAAAGRPPPTTAILMRRRREMSDLADALRDRGIPVEVVGLGGLLAEPEVADVVAVLHLLVNPNSGAAALRILTGARWQLGLADLAALADRATEIGGRNRRAQGEGPLADMRVALDEAATGAEEAEDVPSLVDAIAEPGESGRYSPAGYARIMALADELARLRSRLAQPLPDLVTDIERTIGLDVEVALAGPEGRAHLDAFARVVDDFARLGGGPVEFLDFLATADEREDGLAPGEIEQATGRVQILTVHAAKGLEWEVVAVPQLSEGVFPSGRSTTWLSEAAQLPPDLRGDADDVPALRLPTGPADRIEQSDLARRIKEHLAAHKQWQQTEERRLAYVAVTRAERHLLFSGHHWGATGVKVRGPGAFLLELQSAAASLGVEPDRWDPPPLPDSSNPNTAEPRSGQWPTDPLAGGRPAVEAGADRVRGELAEMARRSAEDDLESFDEPPPEDPDGDPAGWEADVTALLAERAAAGNRVLDIALPGTVPATALVDLAADPEGLARRLRRPVPMPPAPQARRGTAFHLWLEHRFAGEALLGPDELPGADDRDAAANLRLESLQQAFLASAWADRHPLRVEVGFATRIGPLGVRGRIDAVFTDPDGGFTVVDWKTGRPPGTDRADAVAVQLAVYRLAWSELSGAPLELVRACFHHVAEDRTLAPVDLLDANGLVALIESATGGVPASDGPTGEGPAEGRRS